VLPHRKRHWETDRTYTIWRAADERIRPA